MYAHLRLELLAGFGLLIGYFGRSLWLSFNNIKSKESPVLLPTFYGWQDEEHTIPRGCCKPAVLGAPYHLGDSKLQQHQGICPDCGGVTEMYERCGESQWSDAWVEYCTGCGNMVERPSGNRKTNLWTYAGKLDTVATIDNPLGLVLCPLCGHEPHEEGHCLKEKELGCCCPV